jgi:hypothetical protein
VGPVIWTGRQPWSSRRRPRTELERLKERRTAALILACGFVLYAAGAVWLAVKAYRWASSVPPVPGVRPGNTGLPGFNPWDSKLLAGSAAATLGLLAGAAATLWYYRRTGEKIRQLGGHCAICGYDLRGLPEPRCPECGTPFTPPEATK